MKFLFKIKFVVLYTKQIIQIACFNIIYKPLQIKTYFYLKIVKYNVFLFYFKLEISLKECKNYYFITT